MIAAVSNKLLFLASFRLLSGYSLHVPSYVTHLPFSAEHVLVALSVTLFFSKIYVCLIILLSQNPGPLLPLCELITESSCLLTLFGG